MIDKVKLLRKYEVQINAYRELIPCITAAISVIQKFDGKVLNIKLAKALKELTGCYYYLREDKSIEVQLLKRSYQSETDSKGYSSSNYDFTSSDTTKITMDNTTATPRIDAKKTIVNLNTSIDALNKRIEKLVNNYNNIDSIIEQHMAAMAAIAMVKASKENYDSMNTDVMQSEMGWL